MFVLPLFASGGPGSASSLTTSATQSSTHYPTIHSHTGVVNAGPSTTTPGIHVAKGSDLFVFVSYVDYLAGGGYVASIIDSSSNSYILLASTNADENHSESLYLAEDVSAAKSLTVTVAFTGGDTTMGGSVAVVDVVGAASSPIDVVYQESGYGMHAAVGVYTNHTHDLFLLGTAGRGAADPFTSGPHEHLLSNGTATSGPFQDGTGYATFYATHRTGSFALSAGLNAASAWNAIAVGILP